MLRQANHQIQNKHKQILASCEAQSRALCRNFHRCGFVGFLDLRQTKKHFTVKGWAGNYDMYVWLEGDKHLKPCLTPTAHGCLAHWYALKINIYFRGLWLVYQRIDNLFSGLGMCFSRLAEDNLRWNLWSWWFWEFRVSSRRYDEVMRNDWRSRWKLNLLIIIEVYFYSLTSLGLSDNLIHDNVLEFSY